MKNQPKRYILLWGWFNIFFAMLEVALTRNNNVCIIFYENVKLFHILYNNRNLVWTLYILA